MSQNTIWRRREVEARTGLARSTLYDFIRRGDFPTQVSLGGARAVGWRSGEVEAWIESRLKKAKPAGKAGTA